MMDDWDWGDDPDLYGDPTSYGSQISGRIRDILRRALGGADYTFSPLLGGEVEVFLGDTPLARVGEFGSQITINRLRVEPERHISGGRTLSSDDRAVQALQRMVKRKDRPEEALVEFLGGAEHPGREPDDAFAPRGAPYLLREWERTHTQAWYAWEQSSGRVKGLEAGSFGAAAYGPEPFKGQIPSSSVHPVERLHDISAITQGQVGFPESPEGGVLTDVGGKTLRRAKIQRRPALLPESGPRTLPDLPGKWASVPLVRGPVGPGGLEWGHRAPIRAPGVGPEAGIPVMTAVALRGEIGPPGQMWVDPTQLPPMAHIRPFAFPLQGRELTALSLPGVNLGGYGERAEIARTDKGALTMRVNWGESSRIAWLKEVKRSSTGQPWLIGEMEELRPAGSWMEMKFLNKALVAQREGLGEKFGLGGLQAVIPRWKSRRQGAAATFGAMTPDELREVMGKAGLAWGEGQPLVWGTENDPQIMRAWEQYVRENTLMLRHEETVAGSMLPGLQGRMVGEPERVGPNAYRVALGDPFFVGKQLMQFQPHYPGHARVRTEELKYMIAAGGGMAERAYRLIDKGAYQRERYTEMLNLYLAQTRRGREMGIQPVREAVPIEKLDWAGIQAITGAEFGPEELLPAMAEVVGRTPVRMPWGTIWPSPLTMMQQGFTDDMGEGAGAAAEYARAMQWQVSGNFQASRESSPVNLAFEKAWARQVRGPGFRREMMSAEIGVGGIQGGIHGSTALAANEMWVSREALAQLTGVDDPTSLSALEAEIERRALNFRGAQSLGYTAGDVAQEDMPLTALAWRRPVADVLAQMGNNLVLRTGSEFAKGAGLEGAYFAVSPIFQALQWGDFDKDDLIALFTGKVKIGDAESGPQVDYRAGPGAEPMTEEAVIRKLATSIAGRGGAGQPESIAYADLLEYVWKASPPGAQLADLGKAMQEHPTGAKGLEEALAWTGGWRDASGQPLSMSREAIWQSAMETAQAKQMMGQVYQSWGRMMSSVQGKMDTPGYRIWSGVFGGTYQEPLDIREVPQAIRSIMEVQGTYNLKSGWYARKLTPEAWTRDPETGEPRPSFANLPTPMMPQQVAQWAAEATRGKGMAWTPEQAAWMLARPDVKGERQQIQSWLEDPRLTPARFAERYAGLYGDYKEMLLGGSPLFTSLRADLYRRRTGDVGEETKYGWLYQHSAAEEAAAEVGASAKEYMALVGKGQMGPHEVMKAMAAAAGAHSEIAPIVEQATGRSRPLFNMSEIVEGMRGIDISEEKAQLEVLRRSFVGPNPNPVLPEPLFNLGDVVAEVRGQLPPVSGEDALRRSLAGPNPNPVPPAATLGPDAPVEWIDPDTAEIHRIERRRSTPTPESGEPQPGVAPPPAEFPPENPPVEPQLTLAQRAIEQVGGLDALRADAQRITEYKRQHGRHAVPEKRLFRDAMNWMMQQGPTQADIDEYGSLVRQVGVGVKEFMDVPIHSYTGLYDEDIMASVLGDEARSSGAPPPPPPDAPAGPPPSDDTPAGPPPRRSAPSAPWVSQKPWETGAWMSRREMEELGRIKQQLDRWGVKVADAIESTDEVNRAQRDFLRTFERYEKAYDKGTKTVEQLAERLAASPDAPEEWRKLVGKNLRGAFAAVTDLGDSEGFTRMKRAAGMAATMEEEWLLREALGLRPGETPRGLFLPGEVAAAEAAGGGGGGGPRTLWHSILGDDYQDKTSFRDFGALGGVAGGIDRLLSGWELMRLRRMWQITAGPVFNQYIPAAAEVESQSWKLSMGMGGYEPGLPGGVAGGVMAYNAAERQALIDAGRTGYAAWGWTQQSMGWARQLQALAGPAAGYGLVAGGIASTLAAAAVPGLSYAGAATMVGLPVTALVGAGLLGVGVSQYARNVATPTDENAMALLQGEEGGFLGVNWRKAIANLGQVSNNISAVVRGADITPSVKASDALLERGRELAATPISAMTAEQRNAALNYVAQEFHGLTGTIFEGASEDQILAAMQSIMPYAAPTESPLATVHTHGSPYRELLEQVMATGETPAAYQAVADQYKMGRGYATKLFQELGRLPEGEKQRILGALGQYSPLMAFGYAPESILDLTRTGQLPRREGVEALSLERAFSTASGLAQAYGVAPDTAQGQQLLNRALGVMDVPGALAYEQMAAPFASAVSQARGDTTFRFQDRFRAMLEGGVSMQSLGLIAQGFQGQGAIAQALGAPGGFAFEWPITAQLANQQMTPLLYRQAAGAVGLGMSRLGYSMMAGGFGVGGQLSRTFDWMAQFGLGPGAPTGSALMDARGYDLNELALRELAWKQFGLSQRQAAASWQNTLDTRAYQMGYGPWGVPGPSGWGGGLLGQIEIQQDLMEFTQAIRDVNSRIREEQRAQSRAGLEFSERGLEMSTRHQLENLGMSERMWRSGVSFQQRQFGFQWQQMQVQNQWQLEDLAWDRQVSAFQFGYQQDELARAIRLATGRQKQELLRRREYQEEMYAMQESRRGVQEERVEQQQQWEVQLFHMRRAHFDETTQLQKAQFAMQKEHILERYGLEKEKLEEQRQNMERLWALEDERRRLEENWEDRKQQYQLEELQRQKAYYETVVFPYQEQQHRFQLEALGYQEQQMRLQDQIKDAHAAYIEWQISIYQEGGKLYDAFAAFIQDMVDRLGMSSNSGGGGGGGGGLPDLIESSLPAPGGGGANMRNSMDGVQLRLVLDDGKAFNAHIEQVVVGQQNRRAQSGSWGRAWN